MTGAVAADVKILSKAAAHERIAELQQQLERVRFDMDREVALFNATVRQKPIGLLVQKQQDQLVYLRWKWQGDRGGRSRYVMLDSAPVKKWLQVQESPVRRLYFRFARVVVYLNHLYACHRMELKRLGVYLEQLDAIPSSENPPEFR